MVLVIVSCIAVRFDKVQTTLAQFATEQLSKDLNTTIHIGKVAITPLKSIELVDIYALDLEKDTIIKAQNISILMSNINLKGNKIKVKKVSLNEADIQLIKREGKHGFSFQFIIDHFQSETKKEKNNKPFLIIANKIELKNSRFRFKDYRAKAEYSGMDFTDLDAQGINLTFSEFKSLGSNIKVNIDHLSTIEKSKFNLKNFNGNVELDSNFVQIDKLKITTDKSEIVTDFFRFDFDDPSYWEDDYVNKIKMTSYFRKTSLNLSDLAYFTSFFEGIDREVLLSGKFEGTVSDFQTTDLFLKIDKNTEFRGDLAIKGLPKTSNTYFTSKNFVLKTNETELKRIDIPPFTQNQTISLPKEFDGLGDIDISGNITGKFDDLLGNILVTTDQGEVHADVRYWNTNNTSYLDGILIANELNVGHFANEKDLGNLSADLDTKFAWNSKNGIDLKAKGDISQISYNDYDYKDIKIDGQFTDKSFNGSASIKDKNGEIDFLGEVNLENEMPEYEFKTSVKNLNLTKLKLINDTNTHVITANVEIAGKGSNIDNSLGEINISDIIYKQNDLVYSKKQINITSSIKDSLRNIQLESDIADATLTGKFNTSDLPQTFDIVEQQIFPALFSSLDTFAITDEEFEFNILIKDYDPIYELFTPTFYISPNSTANGQLSSIKETFDFQLTADSIQYEANSFIMVDANLEKPSEILDLKVTMDKAKVGNDLHLDNVILTSLIKEDHIMPTIKWRSNNGSSYGKIQGDGYWYSEDYFDLLVLPSYFYFNERTWQIKEDATLIVDSTSLNFNGIEIYNNLGEAFSVVGTISNNPEDQLKVYLDNFDMSNLNPIIGNKNTQYYGNVNGSACVQNVYSQIEIISDLYIDKLKVNEELVGDVALNTDWINDEKAMHIKGELLKNKKNTFDFIGYYYPFKEKNSLDFNCVLENTNLAFLNPYVIDQGITGINGKAKGKIKLTGEPNEPLLKGEISLIRTGFNVEYLNTHYDFSGLLIVENNAIYTDANNLFEIRDQEDNYAFFNGSVNHENYSNFNFDVSIEIPKNTYIVGDKRVPFGPKSSPNFPNRFIALNTTIDQNKDFYGLLYATGDINIEGIQDEIDITVDAKTEKGSSFTLPLYGTSEVELEDYVIFINSDSIFEEIETVNLEGIDLDINLEVTTDTKIQLVFDEVYGDIISARGFGDIAMTVDKQNELNLAGKYTIDEGDYLFTLGLERFENLVNKRFVIANGSTINWYGDPYNADIDIDAIYNLKASLAEIMPKDEIGENNYNQRKDVECIMKLKNSLMSPDISFGIELPRATETERSVVANLIQTQHELYKQVFSLLLLNRFSPTANNSGIDEGGRNGTEALSTTASEILSNQLSNWLSKLSDGVNVGLNYRPGDNITSDEIALALSTELFNDKLVISSNFGVAQGNEDNQNQDALIGDVNVEYKLNEDGSFRVRVFSRTNEYDITNANQSQTTSGVGVYYKKEFNTWKEFITPKKKLREQRQ